MRRGIKQIIISLILLGVFCSILALLYYVSFWKPAICADCETKGLAPISVELIKTVRTDQDYDLVAKIRNSNQDYGASRVAYSFNVYDATGTLLSQKAGETYILKNQSKYVIEPNVPLPSDIGNLKLTLSIQKTDWMKMNSSPPLFAIFDKTFSLLQEGSGGFAKLSGTLVNKSISPYPTVTLVALLYDAGGSVIATNSNVLANISPEREYHFTMIWSNAFSGDVVRSEVEAYANPF